MSVPTIVFGNGALSIEDICLLADRKAASELGQNPAFLERIQASRYLLDQTLARDGVIYGVTTGYGDSCTVPVSRDLAEELPLHLTRFHGCGLGEYLDPQQTRAVLAVRLASLCSGYSGVSLELLQLLQQLLAHDILPRIPAEGSVGASGDLTPLSYVAATLIGERDVRYNGSLMPASQALASAGLQPITLRPKEALAIMNGTAVMTGLACLAWQRADYLSQLSTRITSLASIALQGNPEHFDEVLHAAKPHPGQMRVAARVRADLANAPALTPEQRLQDRYSIRCAPHVIGVLEDSLPWMRQMIETELNSANDNPLIDVERGNTLHGGHFYGGHIALVSDTLKNCVANLADLLDRQLALLVDTKVNHGLPSNLSSAPPERAAINHGFKAVQIGTSAWAAEALKLTMPASVFSRSTECHNQDKVSMGTIAARDSLRVLQLSEQVAAAVLLAVKQAIYLRQQLGDITEATLSTGQQKTINEVHADFEPLGEDRPLEATLRTVVSNIQQQAYTLYDN